MATETKLLHGGLTTKQTKFVNGVITQASEGHPVNLTKAAAVAYDVKNDIVASAIGSENLAKPLIREAIENALAIKGMSVTTLVGNLGSVANVEVEKVTADAKIKANVELLKLLGAYPDRKTAHLRVDLKGTIKGMGFNEAKDALAKLNGGTSDLLDDTK